MDTITLSLAKAYADTKVKDVHDDIDGLEVNLDRLQTDVARINASAILRPEQTLIEDVLPINVTEGSWAISAYDATGSNANFAYADADVTGYQYITISTYYPIDQQNTAFFWNGRRC